MVRRFNPEPSVVVLHKALLARVESIGPHDKGNKDGIAVYTRDESPFLQIQIKRDHMSVELWLDGDSLEEARSSGIARAHPFLGEQAVKIRFERAEDLARVARWIDQSYRSAPERAKS